MAKRLLLKFNYGQVMFPGDVCIDQIIRMLESAVPVESEHDAKYTTFYKPVEGKDFISYELVDDTRMGVDEKFYEEKCKAVEKEVGEERTAKWEAQKALKELTIKVETLEEMIANAHKNMTPEDTVIIDNGMSLSSAASLQ